MAGIVPQRRVRSIPARAGEPSAPLDGAHRRRVYPRACGGAPCTVPCRPERLGLSPRVRGSRVERDDIL